MTGLIDSHCHLDHFKDEEIPGLLAAAQVAGVSGMVTIGTYLSRAAQQKSLTRFSTPDVRIWCTVGTHPDSVGEETLPEVEDIVQIASAPEVIGIGESGLDYFHGEEAVRPLQQESFRRHIGAARELGLPLVIHARQADDDIAHILREETERGAFPMLLHCFASGADLARCVVDLGGYVSFSGISTFPKCGEFRDVARSLPGERVLVETDSPYLAPVPKRGKRNEPAFVAHTAACLAREFGQSEEDFARMTTENFFRLFRKAA